MANIGTRAGTLLFSVLLIVAPTVGASAQRRDLPSAAPAARAAPAPQRAAPAARPAPTIHSAPRTFSRPAPSFRPGPAPQQRPAFTPRSAPRFAAPPQRAVPRLSQPNVRQRNAPAIRRAMPNIPAANRAERRALQMQKRLGSTVQPRDNRVKSLQNRVNRLQAQQPRGLRAQRQQQLHLQRAQRTLQQEQRLLRRDQVRQQRLRPDATTANLAARQAATRGRFASRFNADTTQTARLRRGAHMAPHRAWRRGWHAAFVPWLGPVFWPYVYSDIFDYTFWPHAYDPGYWAYVYDDFVDTVFWAPDASSDYAYAPEAVTPGSRPAPRTRAVRQAVEQVCNDPGKGVTAWPFERMTQSLGLNPEQRGLLDELKVAAGNAADTFKASCPKSLAMTPPGRLQAMAQRIDATLEAVRTVRPALEKFYNALSDEQKARFNAIGPEIGSRDRTPANAPAPQANTCGEAKPGLTQFPIERIEQAVRPTDAQKAALDRLRQATETAVTTLQSECPDAIALTPVGRLEAMQARLEAIAKAAKTVQPALDEFYGSLQNEQKARFNTLNAQASR